MTGPIIRIRVDKELLRTAVKIGSMHGRIEINAPAEHALYLRLYVTNSGGVWRRSK
jgi:hypothetical protein